jgi:hydrogenase maturation protease
LTVSAEEQPSACYSTRPEVYGKNDAGRVAVLGLGNILLSDEGAGVHAVNALKSRFTFHPQVDIIDGGTMGLDLLPLFQTRDRVLIVDAVDFNKAPGHVGVIEGAHIPSVLNSKLSVHHIGLSDVLLAAKLMRNVPPEVCLIGIQPKFLDVGLDMTEEIQVKLDTLIALALQKLKEWNIECVSRSPQKSSP